MKGQAIAGRALLVAATLMLLYGGARWWPRTVDDAFITFRYADNLVAGHGPVFNPGERVEGYTSPTWMLMSAAGIAAGLDPEPLSKVAGLAATLLLPLLGYRLVRRLGLPPLDAGVAALAIGGNAVLAIWSVAGLETNAYAALLFAGLAALTVPSSIVSPSSLLAAAALTRPEGLAFWLFGAGATAPRVRRTVAYLVPGLVLLAHFVWRLAYYGKPLPNTYYAKTGGGVAMWVQGVRGLTGFLAEPANALLVALAALGAWAGFASGRRRAVAVLGGAVLFHLLYVVSVGDDGLRVHRFYTPVLALLACLAALAPAVRPRFRLPALGGLLLVAALSQWQLHGGLLPTLRTGVLDYQAGNAKLGRHLQKTRTPDTVVAVAAAGAIPYHSRLPAIDMYGLNDAAIARAPFPRVPRARLMKWDNRDVLARRPDLIAINRGYFAGGDPLVARVRRDPGMLAVSPMDRDLFRRVAAGGEYGLREIDLGDGSVFFVFEHLGREPDP